jgi:GntR family transcriptional regulator
LEKAVEENFRRVVAEFAQISMPDIPKHVRLRNALLSAMRKGYLKPGDQLPPEQEFAKAVGLSLGTVQRTLTDLATERTLTREQGRGTFIAKSDLSPDDLWQFRFVDRCGGEPLSVSIELLDRRQVTAHGPWADALGYDERGYCELTRVVVVNGTLRCLSRVYVRISRFPKIMKISKARFSGNLKRVLAEEFETPTHALEQFIRPCIFDQEVCALLERDGANAGMLVDTVGRSVGQEAVTFQSLWVPIGEYWLEVSTEPRPLGGRIG